jgi:cytochrome c553
MMRKRKVNTRQIIRNSLLAGSLLLAAPAAFADAKEIAETVCIACHGEGGNSVVPTFPKLAGQHPVYMEKQLLEFLDGKRKNEAMEPFLGNFTKSDVPALAAYYAAQQQTPGEVSNPELLAAGKALYEDGNVDSGVPGCMGCHQANGQGNARYPRLAGQHQAYTLQQMSDFKSGVRTNDRGKLMRAVAERMTEQEMQAVSEYIAGLK